MHFFCKEHVILAGTILPSFIYELISSASSLFSLIAARSKSPQEK